MRECEARILGRTRGPDGEDVEQPETREEWRRRLGGETGEAGELHEMTEAMERLMFMMHGRPFHGEESHHVTYYFG